MQERAKVFISATTADLGSYRRAAKDVLVTRDLNNLAALLWNTSRPGEAEPLMQRTVAILKHFNDSTGHEHPQWQKASLPLCPGG
jgi:hypothetical protein